MDPVRITPNSSEIFSATLSADGNTVAYIRSPAYNEYDAPDTYELHVHDRRTGKTVQITSSENDPAPWTDGTLGDVALTADGSKVLFVSRVSSLTNDDNDTGQYPYDRDIYIYDVDTKTTKRLDVLDAMQADPEQWPPLDQLTEVSTSADGTKIAFLASTGGWSKTAVFFYDTQTDELRQISIDEDASLYREVQISDDGKTVFYRPIGEGPIVAYSIEQDERQVLSINVRSEGEEAPLVGNHYDVSGDGRFVVYERVDDDGEIQIEVLDRQTWQKEVVSVSSSGAQANAASFNPSISDDGRFVVFGSDATNLSTSDSKIRTDLFIHDRQSGETRLLSFDPNGTPNNPGSFAAEISADGKTIMLETTVEWDVSDDNEGHDLYVTSNPFADAGPPNAPPVATDDTATATEDAAKVIDVLANDTDPEGKPLRVRSVENDGPHAGTVEINADGTLTYHAAQTLKAGETVQDVVTYTVVDAAGATDVGTLTVTVTGVNDAPVPNPDPVSVAEGASTGNIIPFLLQNDFDADALSGELKVVSVTAPTNGTVALDVAAQTLTFTADGAAYDQLAAGQTAPTQYLSYTLRDAFGAEGTATVVMNVTGVNDAPVAKADTVTVSEDAKVNLTNLLLSNDTDVDFGDSKTIVAVNATGSKGLVTLDPSTHQVAYDASAFNSLQAGQTAQESFTYTVRDAAGLELTATASVTIQGVNDAPVPKGAGFVVQEDALSGNMWPLLAHEVSDPDADESFTIVSVDTTGTKGKVIFDPATQTLRYEATGHDHLEPGEWALDTFLYTVRDSSGATGTAMAEMTVKGVHDSDGWIYGTNSDDLMEGTGAAEKFRALDDNDRVNGGGGDDVIEGGAGKDTLDGEGGRDSVFGGAGQDIILGSRGDGELDGGADDDFARLDFSTSTSQLQFTLAHNLTGTVYLDGVQVRGFERVEIFGGSGDDYMIGGEGVDAFHGGTGNDRLEGGAGAGDSLLGGQGDDSLALQSGIGFIDGGAGVDSASVQLFRDTTGVTFNLADNLTGVVNMNAVSITGVEQFGVIGTRGADRFTGGALNDHLNGYEGNDTLVGEGGDDLLDGTTGNDLLVGGEGRDRLLGMSGADTLVGGLGDQEIDGSFGQDLAQLDFSAETRNMDFAVANNLGSLTSFVSGTRIKDVEQVRFDGGSGADSLTGGAFADTLSGGAGADQLRGEGGNDVLIGGPGADILSGGDGDDVLWADAAGAGLAGLAAAAELAAPLQMDGGLGADTLHASAATTLTGGSGADVFVLDASDTGAIITDLQAAGGGDRIDVSAFLEGSTDPFSTGRLKLEARGGGSALMFDADGAGSGAAVQIVTVNGVAPSQLKASNFVATSANGAPVVVDPNSAPPPVNVVRGTNKSETLNGSEGADEILALQGQDLVRGRGGADKIDGGDGIDALFGDGGNDTLIGGTGTDALEGGDNDDLLQGGEGVDALHGGAGRDVLVGGQGADVLSGGAGQDRFVFERGGGVDLILDFDAGLGAGDVLDLRAFSGIDAMSDLRIGAVLGSATFSFEGVTITLAGVRSSDLVADDFLFAGQRVAGGDDLFAF